MSRCLYAAVRAVRLAQDTACWYGEDRGVRRVLDQLRFELLRRHSAKLEAQGQSLSRSARAHLQDHLRSHAARAIFLPAIARADCEPQESSPTMPPMPGHREHSQSPASRG